MKFKGGSPPKKTIELMDWSHLRSELTWIYEGPVRPENLEITTFMPGQSAFLIRRGEVLIRTDKGTVTAGPGQWVLPREGLRLQKFAPGSEILSIRFDLAWPGGQRLYDWDVAEVFDSSEAPALEREARRLARWVERQYPNAYLALLQFQSDLETRLGLQQRFLRWLALYTGTLGDRGWMPIRPGGMEPRVLHAVQILDRSPLSRLFREKSLAAQVGLSISQLDRLFVKQLGISPRQYFERRRLQGAAARVQGSSDSFKRIAFDLGFGSLSHFSAWFRRKTGSSPREFRMRRLHSPESGAIAR